MRKTVKVSTGQKKVKLITVNPKDPSVSFEVNTPGSLLNVTGHRVQKMW